MKMRRRKEQVRTKNDQARFSCNCNLEFVGSSKVQSENHGPGTFQCSICENWYVSQKGLMEHQQRVHERLKRFHCDFCSGLFFKRSEIRQHIEASHLKYNLRFDCKFAGCTKFFKTKQHLYLHESSVHSKK